MEFCVLCVFGAFAFDIRYLICECRVRRRGETETQSSIKIKVSRSDFARSRDVVELSTVFSKLAALDGVTEPGQSVCQIVLRSRDPLRNETKLGLNARRGD